MLSGGCQWTTVAAAADQTIHRLPPDEVYEKGLAFYLQIIAAP